MLSVLKKTIDELNLRKDTHGTYSVVVTGFSKFSFIKLKHVKINMPVNEKAFNKSKKIDYSVYDIVVDENDPEVCLIIGYIQSNEPSKIAPINFSDLYDKIDEFSNMYSDYEVISSKYVEIDNQHNARIDIPISSVLVDVEDKIIHLVQSK